MIRKLALLAAMLALGAAAARAMTGQLPPANAVIARAPSPEALLAKSLKDIEQNRSDAALAEIENLIRTYPNFRLAHLIKGDLLLARARPISTLGNVADAPRERIDALREEARARVQRLREDPALAGRVPKYLLQLDQEQKYAVVVDTTRSTLYLYQNIEGEPHYVADYYITIGKNGADKIKAGDQRTPIGVYFVTASLPRAKLTDFYGVGAYPLSYPNEWDRKQGRDGFGIWLHGTPSDTYSRPPRASDGCVVLTNPDLEQLGKVLQIGVTPVIISDNMEWDSLDEWRAQRHQLAGQIEAWRKDWESRDTERYLSYYSKNFTSADDNLAQWSVHKRQVNASKKWIKVALDDVSVFGYPGKETMAVVTFDQDYRSDNLSNRMRKRQYWRIEGAQWKIIYEGAVDGAARKPLIAAQANAALVAKR